MDRNNSLSSNMSAEYIISNDQDALTTECPADEVYTLLKRCTRTALYMLAMVISLLANSAIIWIVRKNRRMRTLTHYLIVNMAVADLLITIFHMPYKLQVQLTNSYAVVVGGLIGTLICKLVGYTQDVSIAISVLSLMVISIDRFMAVVFPVKNVAFLKRPRHVIIPIWITSFVMCSPLLYANRMEEYEGEFYCYEEWSPLLDTHTGGRDYTIIQFTLLYAVPLIVITTLYSCIVFRVWHRRIPGNAAPHLHRGRQHSAAKKKLLKMLIVIVCIFAACWLPYHVIFFLQFASDKYLHCNIPQTIFFYCLFVGHANSAINPCIYFAIHKEYRQGLLQVTRLHGCHLRDMKISRYRTSSYDLKAIHDRDGRTEFPSSFPDMFKNRQTLECNQLQVVVTRATVQNSDYSL